jgi:hypothetical protein
VTYPENSVDRLLKRLGFRRLSARPRHLGQDSAENAAFKNSPIRLNEIAEKLAPGTPIEVWFIKI